MSLVLMEGILSCEEVESGNTVYYTYCTNQCLLLFLTHLMSDMQTGSLFSAVFMVVSVY